MEGDGPTAGSVLFQYSTLIGFLTNMRNETPHPAISKMIATIIDQLRLYQTESLHCDPVILATILNPHFRLSFLSSKYPTYTVKAKQLFRQAVSSLKGEDDEHAEETQDVSPASPKIRDPFEENGAFEAGSSLQLSDDEEIDQYLSGKFPCNGDILEWWRVSLSFTPELANLKTLTH